MKKIEKLDLRVLGNGTHRFDYELDTEFFGEMQKEIENLDESQRISAAKVKACAVVNITEQFATATYSVEGFVSVPCDRCLAPTEVKVKAQDEETAEGDTLDLGWLIYEQVMLSIPMTHMHQDGDCNPEMMEKLNKLLRDNN